jgi:3-hydroxybutyryl-CoA dehydrogenase
MDFQAVGVIGAGVMGRGVAQSLAEAGLQVYLLDLSTSILENARQEIEKNVRLQHFFKKEPSEKTENILARIHFSTAYTCLEEVDFVIENVPEKWELKKDVYERLDEICPAHSILAANTSAIPITKIASVTRRAEYVLGMHFMNPVPLKSTVEVIRGYHTTDATIETARKLLASMHKEAIILQDSPGFVSNRVLMLMVNEAFFLLQEGVATAEDIDKIFKNCIGHKMGPLETADLIGLDTILFSLEVLYESFNDSKYRPCPLLKKMVDARLYGRKSGQGLYSYV